MSVSLVITGLTLPEHAYSDCVYCHPEDMTGVAAMLGVDAAAVVKRGTLVTVGTGELVGYLKCVPAAKGGAASSTPSRPLPLTLLPSSSPAPLFRLTTPRQGL